MLKIHFISGLPHSGFYAAGGYFAAESGASCFEFQPFGGSVRELAPSMGFGEFAMFMSEEQPDGQRAAWLA